VELAELGRLRLNHTALASLDFGARRRLYVMWIDVDGIATLRPSERARGRVHECRTTLT
jgi:hypothetical protein